VQNRFELIMFDLDGTLVETAPEIADAVNDTLWRFKLAAVTQDQVERWIGHGTHELLIQAVAHSSASMVSAVRESDSLKLIYAEFEKNYEKRCGTRSQLYPNVRVVLERLRAAGTRLAVVTNKEKRYTDRVLSAHQLDGFFDKVVCGDSFQTKKPNPQGVRHCLALYAVAPGRALFVGDSSIDIETAKNAGVTVWAVPYGYNMGQPIESSKPDRLIADFLPLLGDGAVI
jgi:phosphoglycolate phosphatase